MNFTEKHKKQERETHKLKRKKVNNNAKSARKHCSPALGLAGQHFYRNLGK